MMCLRPELRHCITPGADPTLIEADNTAISNADNSTDMNVIIFCGECMFPQSDMTCEEKAEVHSTAAELTLEEAKVSILPSCSSKVQVQIQPYRPMSTIKL